LAPAFAIGAQLLTETSLLSQRLVLGLLSAFWLVGSLRYLIPTAVARNLLRRRSIRRLWFTAHSLLV